MASKEDVTMKVRLLKSIEEKLKAHKEYRITTSICEIYLKPKTKGMVVGRLEKDAEVIVLQTRQNGYM